MVTVSDKISPGIDSWVSKPEWRPKKTRITVALEPNGRGKQHCFSAPKRETIHAREHDEIHKVLCLPRSLRHTQIIQSSHAKDLYPAFTEA